MLSRGVYITLLHSLHFGVFLRRKKKIQAFFAAVSFSETGGDAVTVKTANCGVLPRLSAFWWKISNIANLHLQTKFEAFCLFWKRQPYVVKVWEERALCWLKNVKKSVKSQKIFYKLLDFLF